MNEQDLREEICRVGASLFARGYAHATAGKISARTADGGTPIRAVMLELRDPDVWHRSPAEANAELEEPEEAARLRLMTRASSLSSAQIDELREHFGAHW